MKSSAAELTRRIVNASQIAPVGGLFHHYRGGSYKVIDLAVNANTQNVMVVYVPITGPYFRFVRPVEEWSEICGAVKETPYRGSRLTEDKVERVSRFKRFDFDWYPSYDKNFHD